MTIHAQQGRNIAQRIKQCVNRNHGKGRREHLNNQQGDRAGKAKILPESVKLMRKVNEPRISV